MMELWIQKRFPEFVLDVEAFFQSNRIGILGASGSGKSLTLQGIAGILHPDAGRISAEGRILFDAESKKEIKPRRRRIGYLFQNGALFPKMTVEQNIAAGCIGKREEKKQRTVRWIQHFCLTGLENHYPSELSGGQQQRVALARMFANEPEMLLLDEPFSALDLYLREQIQYETEKLLEAYDKRVFLVSHDRDEIYRFCDEVMVLEKGRAVRIGKTAEVFRNPGCLEAARLTGCRNITPTERIDSRHVRAVSWGVELTAAREVPLSLRYLGFPSDAFCPHWEGERPQEGRENRILFQMKKEVELPSGKQIYVCPVRESAADTAVNASASGRMSELCWSVSEEQRKKMEKMGPPCSLELPAERILFLS